jgi:diguanylate cyclase (GGDEF)-like protein/PAS domain S-box-containing protein
MSLRKMIIMITLCSHLVLFLLISTGLYFYLKYRFPFFEERRAATQLSQSVSVLNYKISNLGKFTRSWAEWDDTYCFIANPTDCYIQSNLNSLMYIQSQLNFVLFINEDRALVYGRSFDFNLKRQFNIQRTDLKRFLAPGLIDKIRHPHDSVQGLMMLSEAPAIIAAYPILNSNGQGPIRGYLIMGRYLNIPTLTQLSSLVNFPLQLIAYDDFRILVAKQPKAVHFDNKRSLAIQLINSNKINGFAILKDIYHRPITILQIEMPRLFYRHGQKSISLALKIVLLIGLGFAAMMFFLIKQLILSRLSSFNKNIHKITVTNDLTIRIPLSGNDELAHSAAILNGMLDSLEFSRKELEEKQTELATANQKLRDIIQFLPHPVFVIDSAGTVIAWNRKMEEFSGIRQEEIHGKGNHCYAAPFSETNLPLLIDWIDWEIENIRELNNSVEKDGMTLHCDAYVPPNGNRKEGYYHIAASPLLDEKGEKIGAIESLLEITALKSTLAQLEFIVWHDPLTSLYNRAFFETELTRFQTGAYQNVGLISSDLNGLKVVNDNFGHHAGDQMILDASIILAEAAGDQGMVFRMGGDEFLILLPNCSRDQPQHICDRIIQRVAESNSAAESLQISIALGWNIVWRDESFQENLAVADQNMFRNKRRHTFSSCSTAILSKILGRNGIIAEGHAERIFRTIQIFEKPLQLTEQKMYGLRLLAEFHDIGFMAIPESILQKPGRLTPGETCEVRRHSEIGEAIAESAQELYSVADWILKHHEHWDGNGYPLGLCGAAIPLECRILAIAEAFIAMTSKRPYREPLSQEEAIREIKRCSGSQFDPELVMIFLELMEQNPCA